MRPTVMLMWVVYFVCAAVAEGAGSGASWYRYSSVAGSWPTLRVDVAGPLTITVTASDAGTLALDVLDSTNAVVATKNFSFGPAITQILTVPNVAPGVYKLKAVGDFYTMFRFDTSAPAFVMPGGMDFNPYHDATYFFFVPAGTMSFNFCFEVPDYGEGGHARIYAPDGTLRQTVMHGGGPAPWYSINVEPASRGAFWRVDIYDGWGDFRLYLAGIPNYFAEAAAVWFDPSAAGANHFSVDIPTYATAGVPFLFTVTARDTANAVMTGYTGAVHFTSNDPAATLPADATLQNGVGTFAATLRTLGNRTITATDAANTTVTGSGAVVVGQLTTSVPTLSPSTLAFLAVVLAMAGVALRIRV